MRRQSGARERAKGRVRDPKATGPSAPRTEGSTESRPKETSLFLEFLTELDTIDPTDKHEIFRVYKEHYKAPIKTLKQFHALIAAELTKEINIDTFKEILDLLNDIFHKRITNPTSLDNSFSSLIRTPIKKKFGDDSERYKLSKRITALKYSVKGELMREQARKIFERNKNTIVFKKDEMLSWIEKCISSKSVYEQSFGLLLASGSRPVEFFNKSTYSLSEHEGWLKQTGVAKRKDGSGDAAIVHKPLIGLTPEEFLEMHGKIKTILGEKVDKEKTTVNTTVSKNLNEVARNYFKELVVPETDVMTAYDARGMYANLSYELFGRGIHTIVGNSPNIDVWVSTVLGHSEYNTETSKHYNRFTVLMEDEDCKSDEDIIELAYDKLKSEGPTAPVSQNKLEKHLNGIVKRVVVRKWWREVKPVKNL